jgi:hypothetical protein
VIIIVLKKSAIKACDTFKITSNANFAGAGRCPVSFFTEPNAEFVMSQTQVDTNQVANSVYHLSEAKAFYVSSASLLFCCLIKICSVVIVLQPWF